MTALPTTIKSARIACRGTDICVVIRMTDGVVTSAALNGYTLSRKGERAAVLAVAEDLDRQADALRARANLMRDAATHVSDEVPTGGAS